MVLSHPQVGFVFGDMGVWIVSKDRGFNGKVAWHRNSLVKSKNTHFCGRPTEQNQVQ
ncbi:hypothetical protein HanRHA438_Chr05g0246201 [Helianthus annuus]|nr:hypothetical protein HanIR_Chr05g0254741 [Helianthus annuus]KAJ0920887.1 hypothetical protein HanRHA438_Chr05g0246201 [Helianthus annuus]